nr:hypothetical protein CFP56_17421 [Quercus suber]
MHHTETEKDSTLHGTAECETLHGTIHSTSQAEFLHDPLHASSQPELLHGIVHGTWRRLGPPRDVKNSTTSSETVLKSKRKQQSPPSPEDPLTDKKQKLLDLEAKSLGKLMAENLGSALNNLKQRWDYNQGLVISSVGLSGGLALLWKPNTQVHIQNSSRWFIDAHIICDTTGYRGSPFTWSRNHPINGPTHIRLDRALATAAWKSQFPGASVQHLPMSTSDHSMIAVHLPTLKSRHKRHQPPFRFEAMWLRDSRCAEVVEEAWMEGLYKPDGAQITNCLDSCRAHLSAWNKLEFGHVKRQIERLEKSLHHLEQHPERNFEQIQEVLRSLNYWLDA